MIRFALEVLVVIALVWVLFGSLDGVRMGTYVERHGLGPTLDRVWSGPPKAPAPPAPAAPPASK